MKIVIGILCFGLMAIHQLDGEVTELPPVKMKFERKVKMLLNSKFQEQAGTAVGLLVFKMNGFKCMEEMNLTLKDEKTFRVSMVCASMEKDNALGAKDAEHVTGWKSIPGVHLDFFPPEKDQIKLLELLKENGSNIEKSMAILRNDTGDVLLLRRSVSFEIKTSEVAMLSKLFSIYFPNETLDSISFKYTSGIKDKNIVEIP